ncbi:Protein of unknown function [Flavobacterium glycines]|uniref:DUF3078 domain-containing protein n=1 Tax=Flavobacterium glycines TaxID=551990 RepID=A0A1B9DS90_9FLAO|nr:DUF3078 domain-containing protein [Flavobacterium glycines]OCB72549.1 hypothetical protein FBGL_07870 [Flavobacterium glycines]GEL10041.1 hypothetical protein FGL01_07800 [Flavobacterium glycines]SDI83665.1 Protein of unknown function [Flavobacterium glycines]
MKIQYLYLLIIGFLFLTNTPVFSQVANDSIKNDTVKKIILPVLNDNFYRKPKPEKLKYSFARTVALPTIEKTPPSSWFKKSILGFDISEIAFVNWSAGGTNSVSGLLKGDFNRTYEKKLVKWVNELSVRYGMNKQDGIEIRKTDDALRFNSTFGYRKDKESNWYHSAKLNFNTQFTNGYKYPNKENPISRLFAPAYMFLGSGAEYSTKSKDFVVYLSPFTYKATFVWDQTLANKGAFGVEKATYDSDGNLLTKGKRAKNELGVLVTNHYKKEISKNVVFVNNLSLYSDYINNFGNVDVDCDLALNLVVNQYVKANIGARILYDDDIKNKTEVAGVTVNEGPKTQIKQVLGVGLTYAF